VPKEHQWLPVLAAALPLPIPQPVGLGAPGCGFPRPWSVYRWLPGQTASAATVQDLCTFAQDVARFLRCLQAVDSRGGPPAGTHSFGRGGPLAFYDDDVQACLGSLPAELDRDAALDLWRTALSTPFDQEPRWFHLDVDDGAWTRGRAWALWKALLTLGDPDQDTTVRRYGWRYSSADVFRNVIDDC
jgi:aminoglycoside phosphotransferase (APT) family kinase protein